MSEPEIMAQLAEIKAQMGLMERGRAKARNEHREELRRVEDGLLDLTKTLNGRLSTIEKERLREEGQRAEVARAAAEVKAAKEDRQKSLGWKIRAVATICGSFAALATVAGVLAQLLYHH